MRAATLFVATLLLASPAMADHHHEQWWDFLVGNWTYENDFGSGEIVKGELKFSKIPSGKVLVGEWKDSDGTTAHETSGWQPDRKVLHITGYTSDNGYWQIELSKIGEESLEGTHRGAMADGTSYEGEIVLTKTGEHAWTWEFTGKTGEGTDLEMSGKVDRTKGDIRRRSLQSVQN